MTTRVAVLGATGKMGRLVSQLIEESGEYELVGDIDPRGDLSGMRSAEIAVDVTTPVASQRMVEFAVQHGINILVGTSGWNGERIAALERTVAASGTVGVIIVPNFSLGSVLATAFAARAARFFDSIEIVEAHGAAKVDSPSGTAIRTAELMSLARAELGPVSAPQQDQRARGQRVSSIPVHSLRMNGVVARQDVHFGGTGELLTITHETTSPAAYEAGIMLALAATRSARGVTVGLDKLLGLDEVAS